MNITEIKESGSNNILLWALRNEADIKHDLELQSIINDELFYLVTISDVNLFETFRLSQMYRDKLRVLKTYPCEIPSTNEMLDSFNGSLSLDEDNPDNKTPLHEVAEHVMRNFINLVKQMENDDDIISRSSIIMFLPMLTRKVDVQIPVSFMDMITSISDEEAERYFNNNYPETLNTIVDEEMNGFKNIIKLGFVKGTSIIKYNKRYDQYLKVIKYNPLKTVDNSKLYKFSLLGFHKFDNISHGEVRCSFFNGRKENIVDSIQKINKLKSPLKVSFVIQLPINLMMQLNQSFSLEDLPIIYESSMSSIIDNELTFDDFVTPDDDPDDESLDEHYRNDIKNKLNEISAYRLRINEANKELLNAIPILLNNDFDINITHVFSLLPSIYRTNAVVTIDISKAELYTNHYNNIISDMFKEMLEFAKKVVDTNNS